MFNKFNVPIEQFVDKIQSRLSCMANSLISSDITVYFVVLFVYVCIRLLIVYSVCGMHVQHSCSAASAFIPFECIFNRTPLLFAKYAIASRFEYMRGLQTDVGLNIAHTRIYPHCYFYEFRKAADSVLKWSVTSTLHQYQE